MTDLLTRLVIYAQLFETNDPSTRVNIPRTDFSANTVGTVLHLVFGLMGGVAAIILARAGLRYVLTQGNPQETAKVKDTIIYAVVGLVVSLSAFLIVSFVINRL